MQFEIDYKKYKVIPYTNDLKSSGVMGKKDKWIVIVNSTLFNCELYDMSNDSMKSWLLSAVEYFSMKRTCNINTVANTNWSLLFSEEVVSDPLVLTREYVICKLHCGIFQLDSQK